MLFVDVVSLVQVFVFRFKSLAFGFPAFFCFCQLSDFEHGVVQALFVQVILGAHRLAFCSFSIQENLSILDLLIQLDNPLLKVQILPLLFCMQLLEALHERGAVHHGHLHPDFLLIFHQYLLLCFCQLLAHMIIHFLFQCQRRSQSSYRAALIA